MTDERYHKLNDTGKGLTEEETKQGWHYCYEFDGLLRNSNEEDFVCDCDDYQRLKTLDGKRQHSNHLIQQIITDPFDL